MESSTLEYILHLERNLKYNKVFIVLFDDFCDNVFPGIITSNKELLDNIITEHISQEQIPMKHHDEYKILFYRRRIGLILEKGKQHQMHCSNDVFQMDHVLYIVRQFMYKEYGIFLRISVTRPCDPDRTIMIEHYR